MSVACDPKHCSLLDFFHFSESHDRRDQIIELKSSTDPTHARFMATLQWVS